MAHIVLFIGAHCVALLLIYVIVWQPDFLIGLNHILLPSKVLSVLNEGSRRLLNFWPL